MVKVKFEIEGMKAEISASRMWADITIEGIIIDYNYIQFEIDEIHYYGHQIDLACKCLNLFERLGMHFWNYDNLERLKNDIVKNGGILKE